MEIQVRSLLQHTWASLYHDRVYKSDLKLPSELRRELMRIAAILEDADQSFARAIATLDGYREYYGTYLPRDRLEEELEQLRQVRGFDPSNLKLALKTARIAVALERWEDVRDTLSGFVTQWEQRPKTTEDGETTLGAALDAALAREEAANLAGDRHRGREALEALRDPTAANLLLDYGTALWHLGDKTRARHWLNRAIGLDLRSADALIMLADTYDEDRVGGPREALRLYGRAFEVNAQEPRAVRGYLQLTAEEDRNLNFVAPMRPTLHNAIRHCRERASLGIYLPWAYFDIGCFSLLLGDPYGGLEAYAKAVELSQSDTPLEAALKRARRLCDALHRGGSTEWSLLERFLLIAKLAKAHRRLEHARASISAKEATLAKLDTGAAERARTELEALRAEIAPRVASPACPPLRARLVIVAGACAPADEERLRDYAPLLTQAFRDFSGTLFSGGTCCGIGQIVGDLPDSSRGPLLKVTCLPQALPIYYERHRGYRFYAHPGQSFSPWGAVQVWADILSQGILPSEVRVIGISGGKLAGFEYRLALMMGAKVGVLKGSGRAAAVLEDPDWLDHPNLIALPYDPQTVKLFVAGFSSGALTEDQREEAARRDHERGVAERRRASVVDDRPENQPWDRLRPDLKGTIRERVEFIAEQLNALGLRAEKRDRLPPGAAPVEAFSPEQIEILAEMEHGRWCVRKFLDGWRLGDKKDDDRRTHPDLIPWKDLPDQERDKDRQYARQIPRVLGDQGYAIVPAERGDEGR